MHLVPHLAFDGTCREAFEFYADVLRGKIEMMMTIGETPMAAQAPKETHGRIMHARLVAESAMLMGGDTPQGQPANMHGFCVAAQVKTADEARRIYARLVEGGSVQMPIQKTFWSPSFGMCTDKYGTPWIINADPVLA